MYMIVYNMMSTLVNKFYIKIQISYNIRKTDLLCPPKGGHIVFVRVHARCDA